MESFAVAVGALWVVSRQAASQFTVTYLLLCSKWSSSGHADCILVLALAFVVYSVIILIKHVRQSFQRRFSQSHGNWRILLLANGRASEICCKALPRPIHLGRIWLSKDTTVMLWPLVDVSMSLLLLLGRTILICHSELIIGESYICMCWRWAKWGNWRCSIVIGVALTMLLVYWIIGCLIYKRIIIRKSGTAKFLILGLSGLMLVSRRLQWRCILIRSVRWMLSWVFLFRTLSWQLPH